MSAASGNGRKIVVLCEGDTEELAIRHFVAKQWQAEGLHAVGLKRVNLRGRLQDIGPKTRLFLDDSEVLAVFTLIDLYGMDRVKHSYTDILDTKVSRVCDWLRGLFNHNRSGLFFPHVSVHETEAWILAEGNALARRLHDSGIGPDPNAESRNFAKPPSELINDMFLSRKHGDRYQKIRDGRPLFAEMQFPTVYNTCRYFSRFYDALKAVASS